MNFQIKGIFKITLQKLIKNFFDGFFEDANTVYAIFSLFDNFLGIRGRILTANLIGREYYWYKNMRFEEGTYETPIIHIAIFLVKIQEK